MKELSEMIYKAFSNGFCFYLLQKSNDFYHHFCKAKSYLAMNLTSIPHKLYVPDFLFLQSFLGGQTPWEQYYHCGLKTPFNCKLQIITWQQRMKHSFPEGISFMDLKTLKHDASERWNSVIK